MPSYLKKFNSMFLETLKIPLEEEMSTPPVFLPLENPMDCGTWWAMSRLQESDTTERLSTPSLTTHRDFIKNC